MKKFFFIPFLVLGLFSYQLKAQQATPDLSFGDDGIVSKICGESNSTAFDMLVQTDGKIIVVGESSNGTNMDFTILRFNPDGSPDSGFGQDGIQTTAIGSLNDNPKSVALQRDNKIVVAGVSYNSLNSDIALARYNPDGSLDLNFGFNGLTTLAIGDANDIATSLAILEDKSILVGGSAYMGVGQNHDFALVKFKANGERDSTFGTYGIITTEVGTSDDYATSMLVQYDGKIVLAGWSSHNTSPDFSMVRYNQDGTLDESFGDGGKVLTAVGDGNDQANAMAIQKDGKILLAGSTFAGTNTDFALVRYKSNGEIDSSFSQDGKLKLNFYSYEDIARAIVIQDDGKIVLAGQAAYINDIDFGLARFNPDGSIDNDFGPEGKVVTDLSPYGDILHTMALQADGKIIVGGGYQNETQTEVVLIRYITGTPIGIEIERSFTMNEGNANFMVYPNPCRDELVIKNTDNQSEIEQLRILDISGKQTYLLNAKESFNTSDGKFKLVFPEKANAGFYFIEILTKDKEFTYLKIMKL